jgi:hypothetical protein
LQRSGTKPFAGKPAVASSLGNVPTFADTQQKWEDPAPYGGSPTAETPQTQQNSLKEPSLIFVRGVSQVPVLAAQKVNADEDGTSRLELTLGTRIQAKLETQVSSAVLSFQKSGQSVMRLTLVPAKRIKRLFGVSRRVRRR